DRLATIGTRRGSHLGDDLAIDHRQAVVQRALWHAHGALLAVVFVSHVIGNRHVLGTQGDGLPRVGVGAHGAGGAVGVAVGHLVSHHLRGLRSGGGGVALALGAVHHLAADMVAVDAVADHAAGHGAADGRQLLAVAATDLVAHQAADDRAGHGTADVAVALGQALGHDHVVADLARRAGGAGFA